MKPLLFSLLLLAGTFISRGGDNIILNGKFEANSVGTACDVVSGANVDAIINWRCINVGAPGVPTTRQVHFEILKDPATDSHYLATSITDNPAGDATGEIGFDIFGAPLPAVAGDHYRLKFKAKRLTTQPCSLMVILAGHTTDITGPNAGLIEQLPQTFQLTDNFDTYTFSDWVVPPGASLMNVIFNIVDYTVAGAPFQRCGIGVTDVDLEKIN